MPSMGMVQLGPPGTFHTFLNSTVLTANAVVRMFTANANARNFLTSSWHAGDGRETSLSTNTQIDVNNDASYWEQNFTGVTFPIGTANLISHNAGAAVSAKNTTFMTWEQMTNDIPVTATLQIPQGGSTIANTSLSFVGQGWLQFWNYPVGLKDMANVRVGFSRFVDLTPHAAAPGLDNSQILYMIPGKWSIVSNQTIVNDATVLTFNVLKDDLLYIWVYATQSGSPANLRSSPLQIILLRHDGSGSVTRYEQVLAAQTANTTHISSTVGSSGGSFPVPTYDYLSVVQLRWVSP